jgi:hypothetical protein
VTLLTPLLEPPFCELDDVSLELEDVLLEVEDVPALVVAAVVLADDFLASAGSWPETSTIVISSQLATNRARAPAMMRRRSARARASRVCLIAWPRARAAAGSLSAIGVAPRSRDRETRRTCPVSFDVARSSSVSED